VGRGSCATIRGSKFEGSGFVGATDALVRVSLIMIVHLLRGNLIHVTAVECRDYSFVGFKFGGWGLPG
jgi:hypothetical protein